MALQNRANDWNSRLLNACKYGDLKMVIEMIEKGANNWDECFEYACRYKHEDIMYLLMKKGKIRASIGFKHICQYGHIKLLKIIMADGYKHIDNNMIYWACCSGNVEMVKFLMDISIDYRNNNTDYDWKHDCQNGFSLSSRNFELLPIIKMFIERGIYYTGYLSVCEMRELLNMGLDVELVIYNEEFKQVIDERDKCMKQIVNICDEILRDLYKDQQMYDKNILNIVTSYLRINLCDGTVHDCVVS